MNVIWMGGSEPLRAEREKTEASTRTKKARENCVPDRNVSVRAVEGALCFEDATL